MITLARWVVAAGIGCACGGNQRAPSEAGGGTTARGGASNGGNAGTSGTDHGGSVAGGRAGANGTGAVAGGAGLGAASSGGNGGAGGSSGASSCASAGVRDPNAFVHPGSLHKRSDLERMRFMVASGVEPWATSFEVLSRDARASATYDVRGDPSWTSVDRDGDHGPEFESDANAAYANAVMWSVTGDERHAEKAVEIFNTWKQLRVVVPSGTPALNAGLFAWKLVEAAEIIESTYEGWSAADVRAFGDMLVYPGYSGSAVPESVSDTNGTFYWRIVNGDPGRHGNQDLIAWRAMIGMAVFLDNRAMFERALRYFKGQPHRADDLPYAPGPSPSGAQTSDNDYFTTYQYAPETSIPDYGYNGVLDHYVWESGQNQESSRDQQHAFFGLGICAGIAEVAWNQGDDVYNALEFRLLKGFEHMARYNVSYIASFPDQATPWEPSGADFVARTDRTGRWRSKAMNPHFESDFVAVSRGDFPGKRPVFEQALAHYQVRMGRPAAETRWTERGRDVAIIEAGQEGAGFSLDHPGYGGLTFRRPIGCAGDPISGFSNGMPVFAMNVLPGSILAANYDHFPANGEGHTYHDLTSGNAQAQYRVDDVDIACGSEGRPVLTELEEGEWLTYTVHVPTAGAYRVELRYASASAGAALGLAFDGANVPETTMLPSTSGAWQSALVASAVALRAGVQSLRLSIVAPASGFELESIAISPE